MSDETLAEILSGQHEPTGRAALHAMLDDLLDAAEEDGGTRLDASEFWTFVAKLARGRGIADDIAETAAQHIAEAAPGGAGGVAGEEQALAVARMWQWAMLTALLRRVTGVPGEVVPRELQASWFIAAAHNIVVGRGKTGLGPHMDLLGLGTQRGAEWEAEGRTVKWLLVGAVYFRAEQSGQSLAKTRRALMPDLPKDTWDGWVKEVAKAKRVSPREVGEDARAAARGEGDPAPYDLSKEAVARMFKSAWRPR